jgi:hypothetical protein
MHADRKSLHTFLLVLCSLLWLAPASAYAQIAEQRDCSVIVKNNMAKTKEMKPEVYATIKEYAFE